MPTYEYECSKCGHTFELVQSIHDAPRRRCPRCRGKVHRLIGSGVGIAFKGSGFYCTDARGNAGKGASKGNSNTAASVSDGGGDN